MSGAGGTAADQVAVRAQGLSKTYLKRRSLGEIARRPFARAETVEGLADVDLVIPRGTIYGILGPNGAGKTTFLKILSGLILPTRGKVEVEGHDVATDDRRVRELIGFVTADERSFYWRLSGHENLLFFARLYGFDAAGARRRVDEVSATMEIGEFAGRQFMGYSTGMRQRLAICRALLHDPPVICLDEPTRSLDPIAAKHLRTFIAARLHADARKTVLLATHNLGEAEELCGRVAILAKGRVVRQGSLEEIAGAPPGRERYSLVVTGAGSLPEDPRWSTEAAPLGDGRVAI
ncbi:MAG TPA: ABC transporter ATP-binding protein, partial [Candidatus Polarisedimenticolia bacterium]|nr:ABC transporter ATP-binding protein [Candidatus Polarisedimenticolia bacterium]